MSNEKFEHDVGDIMFFSPNLFIAEYEKNKKTLETSDWGQKKIKQMHKINLGSTDGSDWVSHVGIICSDEDNGLHIAHATEIDVENQNETYKGYVKEPLGRELSRYQNENEDRSFIFFKPNGEKLLNKIEAYFGKEFVLRHGLTAAIVAQELGEEIGKSADSNYHKELEEISWNYSAGLKAIFNPGKLKEDRIINLGKQKVQDSSTICSEFGARALKIGSLNYFKRLYKEAQKDIELGKKVSLNIKLDVPFEKIKIKANQIPGYPHTKSNNTPKGVMHSLINNSDYKKYYYLGKFPIKRITSALNVFLEKTLDNNDLKNEEFIKDIMAYIKMRDIATAKIKDKREVCMDILCYVIEKTDRIKKKYPTLSADIIAEIGEGMTIDAKDLDEYKKRQMQQDKSIKERIIIFKEKLLSQKEEKILNDLQDDIHEREELEPIELGETEYDTQEKPPKKHMEKLGLFEYVPKSKNFETTSDKFIEQVNKLIEKYNMEENEQKKFNLLVHIQETVKIYESTFPPEYLVKAKGYAKASGDLFDAIQYQAVSLGRFSMIKDQNASPLDLLIANMSSDKANKLLELLINNKENIAESILQFYSENEQELPETKRFIKFFQTHTIEFLGGNNSRNFKITDLFNQNTYVLKVNDSLNNPRNIEVKLQKKNQLKDILAPITFERTVFTKEGENKEIVRTLQVTKYYPTGSVLDRRKNLVGDEKEIIVDTCVILSQMAEKMQVLRKSGAFFPDAKLSNWLIDEQGKLRIADTKSCFIVHNDGLLCQQNDYPENKYHLFATTSGYNAPEVFNFKKKKIDIDQIHAYILGKNLYVYATGNPVLYDKNVGTRESDFDYPVFKTEQGKELKSIIMALVRPESDKRMLLEKVPERLFQIRLRIVLGDLEALKFGVNDKPMNDYIEEKMKQIKMAVKNLANKEQILIEMQNTVNALKSNLSVPEVKEMITSYFIKNNVEIDTNIESVISELSIDERIHLLRSLKIKTQLETEQKNEQIDTIHENPNGFMEQWRNLREEKQVNNQRDVDFIIQNKF